MSFSAAFDAQTRLLVDTLPFVASEACFALKGGTAINLFVHDMPRLSVDIDLTYLPLDERETALQNTRDALARVAQQIEGRLPNADVTQDKQRPDALRLRVSRERVQIKVEVSPVLRGSLHPPALTDICPAAAGRYGFAAVPMLSLPDLYGGKICAALDRQHPRDLFDVKLLLDNNGLTREVFEGFLVYLISHSRPMTELLACNRQPLEAVFQRQFLGMTQDSVDPNSLVEAREALIQKLQAHMTANDAEFLISVKQGEPNWADFAYPQVQNLPAVRWKLKNLKSMPTNAHKRALDRLKQALRDDYGYKG